MKSIRHALALLAIATSTVCSADVFPTIRVEFDRPIFSGFTGPSYDNVYINFHAPGNPNMQRQHVSAGRFQGTGSNLVGVEESVFVDGLNDLYMYCYDIYQGINHGSIVTYNVNFNGELDRTRDFLGAVNTVLNAGKTDPDPYAWVHPATGYLGAAIQLGIWESKYETDGSWDLTRGAFQAESLETQTRDAWDAFRVAIASSSSIDSQFILTLESGTNQDMISADPPPNEVPEPGSLALIGTALAAAALARRRRSQPVATH